jgi:hypothetical protein
MSQSRNGINHMHRPTTVIPMGACLLHGPLNPIARDRVRIAFPKYGTFPGVYTFGEMFQALDVLLGRREVPDEIRPIANMRPNFVARESAAGFGEVDVVLVEPSSPIDLEYQGCNLNRTTLTQIVLAPIRATGREGNKAANQWLRTGLIGLNEEVRASAAEELVRHIPSDLPEKDFFADVIMETRSRKADVLEGLKGISSIVQKPMGIVLYVFQYLPDGRTLSWPEGFLEEIMAAAEEMDLKVFQPADVVRSYGITKALRDDLRHYNPDFMPVVAESLCEFADSIAASGGGRSVAAPDARAGVR